MGILDQAKKLGDKVSESVTTFSSDEVIANTIIKAVDKQEKVNALLLQKGSNYRCSGNTRLWAMHTYLCSYTYLAN